MFKNSKTYVVALGGLGEVGKNMYCLMHNDELIIIDAGVSFPEDLLLGIDYIIPDYSFLKKNEKKIKALIITHGHEDHIGGIPFLLQSVKIPVIYAPKQAANLIKRKLEDKTRPIDYKNISIYTENTKLKFKYFSVEFFITNHSIADSHGIIINTPNGTVVTTGDFKFDLTPIGPIANFYKMAEAGNKGVRLLISDSTNALIEGFSMSESKVDEALSDIIKRHDGRIIIATFASNIYRLKHIIEACRKENRKIAIFGRSMENSVSIGEEGGYFSTKDIIVSSAEANRLPANQIVLLCTGSQGEPLAALSRIADGSHPQIQLIPNDLVVFSSSPIPGNARSINRTINKLYLKGVKVYTSESIDNIHTSGHGDSQELQLMIRLIKPEYFMPFHGEYRMLKKHADLAIECGIKKENTFILQNGDMLIMTKDGIKKGGTVQADDIYVDGNRIGDVGNIVIRDRKRMSTDGILIVICNIDMEKRTLLTKPLITTRGFVLVNENEELLNEICEFSSNIAAEKLKDKKYGYTDLKNSIIQELTPYLFEKTGRRPIILPVIMDIKK
jgi:ribonuclease J